MFGMLVYPAHSRSDVLFGYDDQSELCCRLKHVSSTQESLPLAMLRDYFHSSNQHHEMISPHFNILFIYLPSQQFLASDTVSCQLRERVAYSKPNGAKSTILIFQMGLEIFSKRLISMVKAADDTNAKSPTKKKVWWHQ